MNNLIIGQSRILIIPRKDVSVIINAYFMINKMLLGKDAFWASQSEFGIGYFADLTSPFGHYWVIITAQPGS